MSSLTDLARTIATGADGGNTREYVDMSIRLCDKYENFVNFVRDNVQAGTTTVFKYDANKIVVTQECYSDRDFVLTSDVVGDEVRVSIPHCSMTRHYSVEYALPYCIELEGLCKAYYQIRSRLRRRYFETIPNTYLPRIGLEVKLAFNLVPLGTQLINIGDRSEGLDIFGSGVGADDTPSKASTLSEQYARGEVNYMRFELPLKLKDGTSYIFGEKYLAERIYVRGENITVDFYHDMSPIDDGCKYNGGLLDGMHYLISSDFVSNLQGLVSVDERFKGGHFVVLLTCSSRFYFYVTPEDKIYDVTGLVNGCQLMEFELTHDLS